MHDKGVGRAIRVIRTELGLRQVDLATRAGCSQSEISRIERGLIGGVTLGRVRHVLGCLDAGLQVEVLWRGGELDRLLDEGHARIVSTVARILGRADWQVETEVTFSIFGERGSIDVLGWHAATRTLVVIEVKTEIVSVEETERRLDVKVRLAPSIWRERTGQTPRSVARLLVVANTSTNRRRVQRHAPIFDARYPARGRAIGTWMASPTGALSGLMFLSPLAGAAATARRRVRAATPRAAA